MIKKLLERDMLKAMCEVKLMDRKNTSELMSMLRLTVSMEMAAKANALKRFEHVSRAEKIIL